MEKCVLPLTLNSILYDIVFTALGLSMDACAASIALSSKHRDLPKLLAASVLFGIFQAFMPLLGYFLGLPFEAWIEPIDHWVAFFILGALGLNMCFDLEKEHGLAEAKKLNIRLILSLAFATSIDAFVVGIGIHALGWSIGFSVLSIGLITAVVSGLGVFIGRRLHKNASRFAEKIGGLILIFLGIKILISHLFF